MAAKRFVGGFLHVWVQMHRVDHDHILPRGQARQGAADPFQAAVKILPPVARGQNQAFGRVDKIKLPLQSRLQIGRSINDPGGLQQGIDHRIAGDQDAPVLDALGQQVPPRGLGRREMQIGDGGGHLAVHLFRPGGIYITRAQAGLHMTHRGLLVERGQGGGKCGCGIALHQHPVGPAVLDDPQNAGKRGRGDVIQSLARLHDVQIIIGLDLKDGQNLVQHLPVLGGDTDQGLNARRRRQRRDDRGQLDGFGPSAEYG